MMGDMDVFRKAVQSAFMALLVLSGLLLVVMMFMPNVYRGERNFEKYYRATLDEGDRRLPIKTWYIGPKTWHLAYDSKDTEIIYVGRDGDPAMSYTEAYFADGGTYLGYYQRLSTGSSYADGFTPAILEYEEISRDEFLAHVPE